MSECLWKSLSLRIEGAELQSKETEAGGGSWRWKQEAGAGGSRVFFFLSPSSGCASRAAQSFPPRVFSPLFFLFSLPWRRRSIFDAAQKVFSLLYVLEVSPELAAQLLSSPSTKKTTLDEASCRCGRGEKKKKKDAMLGVSIYRPTRRKQRALSATAAGFLSSRNFVSLHELHVSQQARGEIGNSTLFLQSRRKRTSILWGRHRLRSILSRCCVSEKKNSSPAPSSRSRG